MSAHLAQLIQPLNHRKETREKESRKNVEEEDEEERKGENYVHALFTIKIIDHEFHLCARFRL